MTQKKRIYDLAKEYGMSGQDLAKKLKDRGFSQIKGQMSVLDDFQVLQIQGLLEAEGLKPVGAAAEAPADPASDLGAGGLVLRKKKKRLSLTGAEMDAEEKAESAAAAPAPTPKAAVEPAPGSKAATGPARKAAPQPTDEDDADAAPTAATDDDVDDVEVVPRAAPARHPSPGAPPRVASEPSPTSEPVSHETDGPTVQRPAARHDSHASEAPPAPTVRRLPSDPDAPSTPQPMRSSPAAASSTNAAPAEHDVTIRPPPVNPKEIVVPPPSGVRGKVVGFIDLSKLKTTQKKPMQESRRLRSKDDVAPNVQPTLGHDKKKALVRGDRGTRENLSASQLREREAGRFLRRSTGARPGAPSGPGQQSGRPERSRGRIGGVSPYAGTKVGIDLPVTVKKLAEALSVKPNEVLTAAIRSLGMDMFKVNINTLLDEDTAILLAHEFDVDLAIKRVTEAEEALIQDLSQRRSDIGVANLSTRPPTVAVLGHVDHGKTTLIDAIRNSRVAEGEAGGITQHIGAYQVTTKKGHKLTIIDTPGHAAFTSMRARGAKAVDIVILVVAADDGPMPQTEEAINHARAAKVPIVVALTKSDKPEANLKRAQEQLGRMGLIAEEWGGDTAMMSVSALKKQGVDELLERVFLQSEMLELKCHPEGPAMGVVLEAEIHEGKGIVAHLLIQDGTLQRGDVILAGEGYGKVRSMHDDLGRIVENAPPSMPVEVAGLDRLPSVGETFYVVQVLGKAKEVAEEREKKSRAVQLAQERRSLDAVTLLKTVNEKQRQVINLVVRADVQGSVEVLKSALSQLKHDEVEVKVLHAGVGQVTESDVMLAASASGSLIVFHASVTDKARILAEREGVAITYYEVLYQLLDDVRDLMEGLLAPEMREEITGHAEIRRIFKSSKIGNIAGCMVLDGSIFRDSKIRVRRQGALLHEGSLSTLKREKDDVKEVREGFECGIVVRDFQEILEGDVLEAFRINKVKRLLGDKAKSSN